MKRKPNNYGTIKRLGGVREFPFAVYTPLRWANGKRNRDVIGYFRTYEEADAALANWNRNRGSKVNYSLKELYDEWSEKALPKVAKQTADCYRAAWKQLLPIENMKVRSIRTGHFQDIVDSLQGQKSYSSIHNIKVLAGLLEKYAMQYDIIEKNYAEFIIVPKAETEEKEIFTAEQLEKIEQFAENGNYTAKLIIILCYTGWRISEFLGLGIQNYDQSKNAFTGGLKTDNGKNRVVPVHPHIQNYVDELIAMNGPKLVCREDKSGKLVPITANYFRKFMFGKTLDELDIRRTNGEPFTPHATRHTFATFCHKEGVDPLVTKKLLGHSPTADVTEKTYIHVDLDMLNEGISKLKSAD